MQSLVGFHNSYLIEPENDFLFHIVYLRAVKPNYLGHLLEDGEDRVSTRGRLLKYVSNPFSSHLAQFSHRFAEELFAIKNNLTADDAGRRFWQQSRKRECSDALAASTLSHDRERLTVRYGK
jgi:hypothetical protein